MSHFYASSFTDDGFRDAAQGLPPSPPDEKAAWGCYFSEYMFGYRQGEAARAARIARGAA